MLGRLARWLRALGLDTAYDSTLADPELVRRANAESRVLLTRDRHLLRELRPDRALEITSDRPLAQLQQTVTAFGLAPPAELFTRCLLCNASLALLTPEEAARSLPPGAALLPGPVRECPVCGRVYWLGSHARRMHAALRGAFPAWEL